MSGGGVIDCHSVSPKKVRRCLTFFYFIILSLSPTGTPKYNAICFDMNDTHSFSASE